MRWFLSVLLVSVALASGPRAEVLETAPQGSELDLPGLRNALDVFPDLFASAESLIEISQMYMLWYRPESRGAILFAFYDRLIEAARRGVKVRILLDSTTLESNPSPTYRRMRDSLNRIPGIEVRAVDFRPYSRYPECMLHTKYIIVDASTCVIGSHNWSYSAFADNRELSLLVKDTAIAHELRWVFDTDWLVAVREFSDSLRNAVPRASGRSSDSLLTLVVTSPFRLSDTTVLSTADALRRTVGQARSKLDIEVNSLTTRIDFGEGKHFLLLDSLLRKVAGKGVSVRLLVDKWAYDVEPQLFRNLEDVNNIEVRVIDISELGPLPGTGTVHAKLVIADGKRALLGSATFSQRQIMECRNVGLLVKDRAVIADLQKVFDKDWNSAYCFRP